MVLNYVWIAFFVIAFVVAVIKVAITGDVGLFSQVTSGMFDSAKTSVDIAIGLIGMMTMWLGIMRVGEKAGMIERFARAVSPFFSVLFPGIPKKNPAIGSVMLNFSANMLGLDNAATPLGLKAMQELQDLNTEKEVASDAQIMFLVLNTAGITLIPTSVMAMRLAQGAANPADIFIPTLIGTLISFISGMIAVALYQRINLFRLPVLVFLLVVGAVISLLVYWVSLLPRDKVGLYVGGVGAFIILGIIVWFIVQGMIKKINVYETFIDGAKEGFKVSVMIIPYLVAFLIGISALRTTGCMDYLTQGIGYAVGAMGLNTDFVPALPVGIMKTFSGGGARAAMVETMEHFGADSFQGRLACIMQGSTETTFYVLAVYFGSVNIKKTRYAVTCGLIADVVGVIGAIIIGYLFFH
jgi:spore maturation protein SpmA